MSAAKRSAKFKRAAYVLRTCDADMTSFGGFKWPKKGMVECPDWEPAEQCGNGLHGFLNGEGDGGLASFDPNAKWIVAEIEEWIELKGKVKFPRANVVHCGDRLTACQFLRDKGLTGAIVGGTATAGDHGTATAGDHGTATAGYRGTATAGDHGTATAGYRGTATAGDGGTLLIRFYDGSRYRIITGYVGENSIMPNQAYRVVNGKLAKVSK